MNSKTSINSQLLTTESEKKQTKQITSKGTES